MPAQDEIHRRNPSLAVYERDQHQRLPGGAPVARGSRCEGAVREDKYTEWSNRSPGEERHVYMWADGIHCNVRFNGNEGRTKDENRPCLLLLMGATADGTKELIAVVDGRRESQLSWKGVLLSLQVRGLIYAPELTIGDGALGFWKTSGQVYPSTRIQRCTVHKTANVLNKLPTY